MFAVDMALLGVLAALSPKHTADWTIAPAIFGALAAVACGTSLVLLSVASFPRTGGPKGSLLFFCGIAQHDFSQFKESACKLTIEGYLDDLYAQCHRNAEIAESKFAWVQRALLALYVSAVPWALAVYLLYADAKFRG
ncbi:MAG: hypothetical protein HGA46_07220 [Chlorobiaceae bacterium]|nr:hypothetical protein [Chlorobiaceae bacterium]